MGAAPASKRHEDSYIRLIINTIVSRIVLVIGSLLDQGIPVTANHTSSCSIYSLVLALKGRTDISGKRDAGLNLIGDQVYRVLNAFAERGVFGPP